MSDCNTCQKIRPNNVEPVPYLEHRADLAMMERGHKRIFCILLVVLMLWFATIGVFVWYLNQYDFESYEYSQDGEGVNIIGDKNGVDFYGAESESSPQN